MANNWVQRNDDHLGKDDHARLAGEMYIPPVDENGDAPARPGWNLIPAVQGDGVIPAAIRHDREPVIEVIEEYAERPDVLDAEGKLLLAATPSNNAIVGDKEFALSYGTTKIRQIHVEAAKNPKGGRPLVQHLEINGEPVEASPRFWTSLMANYGFSPSIFSYFSHSEVFERIAETKGNEDLRYTIERRKNKAPVALAVVNPKRSTITSDDLMEVLGEYGATNVNYMNGAITSMHTPRIGGDQFLIGPDSTINKFQMEVPVDGWGKPVVFLAMERIICANGAVARIPAFKSELQLGKGMDAVAVAVRRAMDSFNNDEGFAALRERMEASQRSWASVYEANTLYERLVRLVTAKHIKGATSDEAKELGVGSAVLTAFHQLTGDVSMLYGMANPDAMPKRRQRTLPVKAKVYDLVNFATEIATHQATEYARQQLHAWVGTLVGSTEGFDMEESGEKWTEFKDFFATASREPGTDLATV